MINEFQKNYPDIALDLNVSDEPIDPVKTGVDCALQIHPTTSTDLISRPLFPVRRYFCATPKYLSQHGALRSPETSTTIESLITHAIRDATSGPFIAMEMR